MEIVDIEIPSDFKLQNFVDTKVKLTKTTEEKDSFLFRDLESKSKYTDESWRLFRDWNVKIQGDYNLLS